MKRAPRINPPAPPASMQYPSPSTGTACVGRERELDRLHRLYSEAADHGERLALVEGRTGVGKSSILSEFRSRVRLAGGVVLEGRCEPGRAFGPFAEIVERALRFLEEMGREPGSCLDGLACRSGCHPFWFQHPGASRTEPGASGRGASDDVDALEKRLRFFEAMSLLLREVAKVRAPVVVLHDLERADRGTVQLLSFLCDGSGPLHEGTIGARSIRALFVASVRSDVDSPHAEAIRALRAQPGTATIEIGHLDEAGVRAYLQSADTVARVLSRTGGNPEAIDLLLDGDLLTPEGRVTRRTAELSEPARALLEALSVVGRPADADLLARIAGASVTAGARAEFGASELVTRSIVDGVLLFAFAREADREHAYRAIPEARRRALHGRCIEPSLGRAGHEEDAARHALEAGDFARAIPLAMEAASALAARHAHGEAAAILSRAASAVAEPDAALREQLAEHCRAAGDYKQAIAQARALCDRAPDDAMAARRLGELLVLAGLHDDAAQSLRDARELAARSRDPLAVVDVDVLLAELFYQRASYGDAHACAEQALDAAIAHGELTLELQARNTLGKVALARRDAAFAAILFETNREKAAAASLRRQEAQALTNLGVTMLRRQQLADAERTFAQAIEVATHASDSRERAIATENVAVLAHWRHDYARAQSHYHEAVALLKRLGNRPMLARVAVNLGELYLDLNDVVRARSLCDFSAHVGGTSLPPSVTAESLILRGRIDAAEGNHQAARTAFGGALRIYERLGEASRIILSKLELARIALAEGGVAEARGLLADMPVPESPKREAEVAIAAADVERAAGGDVLGTARRAVEMADRADDEALLLPALARASRAALEEGQLDEAARLLDRANQLEARLTERVPPEALPAWNERATRAELCDLASRLAAAEAPRRPSSVPPPQRAVAGIDRAHRFAKRYPGIVGTSPAMSQVLGMIDKVAPTDALVLIRGESGTGKELVAEALHRGSPRRDKPFVKMNCAALVETLLLSELFGHERGAFTGASARKKGRFELADGGTIFLDEIGDISAKTQVALLRVLQEREFERVGGTQPIKVDVRIIAATHRDLEAMVREGTFREDLYYRLRGVMIEVPALRQRIEDLPAVCDHLLTRIARERGDAPKLLSHEVLRLLASHRWPGNVRELENVLRSATLFADAETLRREDFAAFNETFGEPEPETSISPDEPASPGIEELIYGRVRAGDHSLFELKKVIERECIARALEETGGNITRAASLLGMKRPRLSQLVKQYGLVPSAGES